MSANKIGEIARAASAQLRWQPCQMERAFGSIWARRVDANGAHKVWV